MDATGIVGSVVVKKLLDALWTLPSRLRARYHIDGLDLHPVGKSTGMNYQVGGKVVITNNREQESVLRASVVIEGESHAVLLDDKAEFLLPSKATRSVTLRSRDLPWPKGELTIRAQFAIEDHKGKRVATSCTVNLAHY